MRKETRMNILLPDIAVAETVLRSALRQQGVMSRRDVRSVILEEDGHLSVISKRPATP